MAFRTTIDLCSLLELPYTGSDYTWAKNKRNPHALQERLDWCFINKVWNDRLNLPQVSHLDYYGSYHRAILIVINFQEINNEVRYRSRFIFAKMWLKENECSNIIIACWQHSHGNPIDVLTQNLSACAAGLQSWHHAEFASARHSNNKIRSLADENGNVLTSNDDIATQVSSYFEHLFQAEEEDYWALQHVLQVILTTVTDVHNNFLLQEFTIDDVFEA
ncbi:uncharacterized protein LOC115696641 [Cannabis sativa]|uniref:uncharacterized protein LOC115696641 n=1 Tax=Cannabis sativa TaxID=3483 RepID=UPI0011DF0641|nr:uncharacterized protein LOC115696641 [Cannabis sativa]